MLVLLLLDLLQAVLDRFGSLALEPARGLAEELPVQMVLGLGLHDAFGGHELRGLRWPASLGAVRRRPERRHARAARRAPYRAIACEGHGPQRGLVDLHPALLGLQHL